MWNGTQWCIDIALPGYCDNINHAILMARLKKSMEDTPFLHLIRDMLAAGDVDDGQYHKTQSGTPQGGIVSPPTQWQPFFFGIVITRIRVDPKHAIDLVTRDFHPLAQRPDEVALARPGGRLQPVVESGGKVLQPADNPLQLPGPGGFLRQRLALLLQPGKAQAQAGKARRKRGLVNATLRLPVDQPGR
jgi:hypothetical protein